MELSVKSTSITEPITRDEVKAYMGYPLTDTSQDDTIDIFITTAREFLEGRTALSIVSKDYEAYFDIDDADESWYELPVIPVTKITSVTMNGVSTTYQQRGLKTVSICPDSVFGTILVGTTISSYIDVLFTAGASNQTANNILLELVSIAFNNRGGGDLSYASLPYDLQKRINSISNNL